MSSVKPALASLLHYSTSYFFPISSDQSGQVQSQVLEWPHGACKGKIMSTTKAPGRLSPSFIFAEARDKEREHAREHHYKSICTLYLITNGFREEFENHQHCCFTVFPPQPASQPLCKLEYKICRSSLSLLPSVSFFPYAMVKMTFFFFFPWWWGLTWISTSDVTARFHDDSENTSRTCRDEPYIWGEAS